MFESFSTALRNAAGRMSAEQLKEQVMRVLRVWEAWSVYPQPFLATLHVRETPVSAKHATQRTHRTTRTVPQETFLRPAPQEEEEERAKVREGAAAEDDGDEDIDGIPRTPALLLAMRANDPSSADSVVCAWSVTEEEYRSLIELQQRA